MDNLDENITRATSTSFLIEFARTWCKKRDLSFKLASALIYANLAELFADDLIECIHYEDNSKFSKSRTNTNMQSSINELKKLEFPSKTLILGKLNNIKQNRDDLFHGLIRVLHKENYSVDGIVLKIKTNTELFMKECINIQSKFPNYNKFLKLAHEVADERKK